MKTTRRDLFKFAAGSAAGILLTPAPWRLVTDGALWSENWPGIPRPARGETRTRFTHCALCPAGCAVRARCVNDQPVALTGVGGQTLCAFGLTGHQTPYHAGRVLQVPVAEARAAVARQAAIGSIAILDLRPGRTASWTYRRAISALHGWYLAPQSALPAVNLQKVKTILSFGVPVMDGWGTPANVLAARAHFRLIQAEPVESQTAMLADLWLPVRPGTEEALAAGILNVLRGGSAVEASSRTAVPETEIEFVANELARGDALVLAAQESPNIQELNRLSGALGRTVVGRRETPVPRSWLQAAPVTQLDAVPDRSIAALLIDESVCDGYYAWNAIAGKLAPSAVVVAFASSRSGFARYAQFTLPTAVYPEMTDDIPPAVDSVTATFRLAAPLVPPPPGVVDPADFIGGLAGLKTAGALRERADAIHASGRGAVTYSDGRSTPIREVKPDEFWKALQEGGSWIDGAGGAPTVSIRGSSVAPVVALTWEQRRARNPMSPLLSKIYEESNLRVRI